MKAKIGKNIYNTENEPIMLIFRDNDAKEGFIKNIQNMDPDALRFCEYPEGITNDEIMKFMKDVPIPHKE